MGHSTVTVSQRYVHPTPETLERAFQRLEERKQRAGAKLLDGAKTTTTSCRLRYSERHLD
jgi:hypothetical protein